MTLAVLISTFSGHRRHQTSLPAMSYPVSVVTHQPGLLLPPAGLKTEVWTSDVCDCCEDMHICCLGCWCPCCLACQVSSDLGECYCLPLLDMFGGGMIPPVSLALRSTFRERYRIQGGIADDCCVVTCCSSCSRCQMARELKARRSPIHTATNPSTHRTTNNEGTKA